MNKCTSCHRKYEMCRSLHKYNGHIICAQCLSGIRFKQKYGWERWQDRLNSDGTSNKEVTK